MATIIQRSFAGGEVSPSLYGRADQVKYATGLRACRNFMVLRHGGVATRPGTLFVGETKYSSRFSRLIPFIFNNEQTYVLEFGHLYMRVHRSGAQVLEAAKNITAITQANPASVSVTAHGLSTGDEVVISGVGGMTELNGRNFTVVVTGANTFTLKFLDGSAVDSTGFGAYTSGGTIRKVFELVTPYDELDLDRLQYVQSADVITIVHPSYAPRDLSRLGDTNWTLSTITFTPTVARPNGGTATVGPAGANSFRYRITSIDPDTREESLPGLEDSSSISAATQANPVAVTTSGAHGFVTGDEVHIYGVVGMTELNDRNFIVTVTGPNDFTLDGEDGTSHGVYTSGGTAARTYLRIDSAGTPSTSSPHTVNIPTVSGVTEFNIYKEKNGVYGFLGIASGSTFKDVGLDPDTADTPPSDRGLFGSAGDFPSTVTYFQQRRMFANTDNDIEDVFGSRSGSFTNFTKRSPIQDDDSVRFTLAGRQVNAVRHLLDLGGLVVLTQAGEWNIRGNAAGILVPAEVNPQQISYYGASNLAPLIVGNTALFVQGRGSIVRDLGFDFQVDNYRGNDLTIFASHLFDGFEVTDWAFQQIPHSIIWAVRGDGTLLGLTYVREHQVVGWHRHDFDGLVEAVAAVPEGSEDAVYLTIKRTVNGRTVRYVERMASRRVDDILDFVGMDAALTFDGRNTDSLHTMTLSGGTAWDNTETLTLTSSASFFAASSVGNAIHLTAADGSVIRCTIEGFTSTTVVTVRPHKLVPVDLRSAATSSWANAVDTIGNLHHLEGKSLSVLADGFVAASPNNDAYVVRTVTNGQVTLDKPYSVIHAGLPVVSDFYTLDIDTAQGQTIVDKRKFTSALTIFVEESRGIFAGTEEPPAGEPLSGLFELKIRNAESYDDPVALATGAVDMNIEPNWNRHGRVFIRQVDPVPLSILAVAPAGLYPFGGGG